VTKEERLEFISLVKRTLTKEEFDRFKRAVTRLEEVASDPRFGRSPPNATKAAADYNECVRAPLEELVRLFRSTADTHVALLESYKSFVPPSFLSEYRFLAALNDIRSSARFDS
jgi:hypothetical protein